MRKSILIVILMIIALTLSACSQQIREGEVYDREFVPAHTEHRIVPMFIYNGKKHTTIMIPYTYYYDDDYILRIRAEVDGEIRTATYHVTKEVYEACPIGSQFVYDPDVCFTEAPYTREREKGD